MMGVHRTYLQHWSILLFIIVAFVVAVAALGSAIGIPELPEPLAQLEQRLPVVFRVHMVSSGLGLLLLPWTIALRSRPAIHRLFGRCCAVLVFVGALTSLPTALQSGALPLARIGFLTQGMLCLAFLAAAVRAIRMGDIAQHARLMLQMSAMIFGAVILRIMMALATRCGLPFDTAYVAIAWLSWLLPLGTVSAWPRLRSVETWRMRSQITEPT
jgi:uncharacterized membrane protein